MIIISATVCGQPAVNRPAIGPDIAFPRRSYMYENTHYSFYVYLQLLLLRTLIQAITT